MMRLHLAFALLTSVYGALAIASEAPAASASAPAAATVDQAAWTAQKRRITLPNGLDVAYVELGDPEDPPLLLLHGYTDTSRSWSLIAPHLPGFRLLIPDQRGHGATGAPACCFSVSQFAEDARLFLDALGIGRAAVAGHSMGSMVAIAMAAEHPGRVSDIILIGSTALSPVKRGDWLYENVAGLTWPLDPNSQFMRDWHPANQPTPVDPVFAAASMEELLQVQPHVWRGVMRELAYVPVGRHVVDVRARVQILSGGKDPLFPAEHHQSLVAAFPSADARVYPELGHNPLWERPTELAADMVRFLRQAR